MKLITTIAITFLSILYNCGAEDDYGVYGHRIKIDSIVIKHTAFLNDTIPIKFYGQIGTRSNQYFDRIDVEDKIDSITFAVFMKGDYKKNYAKTTYLNGEVRKVIAMKRGILRLIVLQPDNATPLSDSIVVL